MFDAFYFTDVFCLGSDYLIKPLFKVHLINKAVCIIHYTLRYLPNKNLFTTFASLSATNLQLLSITYIYMRDATCITD